MASVLLNLAQLLQATNRLTEAEALMRRALAIDEAGFGKDHPNLHSDCTTPVLSAIHSALAEGGLWITGE